MAPKNKLQHKLLGSVSIIVTLIILSLTALVTGFEKNRFEQMEFKRIYYETSAIKKRIGHLMFGSNWRYLMITLSNAKLANPAMIYFALIDMEGKILVSDNEDLIGKDRLETIRLKDPDHPLFETSQTEIMDQIPSRFRIYLSRANTDLFEGEQLKARENEVIFDAFWEVTYMGEKMGTLRVGFSRQGLNKHLRFLVLGMLGTGFFVLVVTLGLIFLVVRSSLEPLDRFLLQLSGLQDVEGGRMLKKKLDGTNWESLSTDIEEIQRLKQTFSKVCSMFVTNWEQLENHRNNLEKMVTHRTAELNDLNTKLTRQIEERKEIEARLLNVQKLEAVGTLAGGIAHEFNNLFMAIAGYASLIEKQSEEGHPNAVKASKIKGLVDTGAQSIKQLLGFARSGKFDPGPLNINEVLRGNLKIFTGSRKDLTLDADYAEDIWPVRADRSQMEQVIMNLLLNASEAMPDVGKIRIQTCNVVLDSKQVGLDRTVSGPHVSFSVQDNGPGMSTDVVQRIFDPFFTTKPIGNGTGLGLASVFGIVDNHDGFIVVESEPGKGTRFDVFLPAMSA